jgi:small subunit ribosomal protein S8
MTMTDPIADMLTRIRNANMTKRDLVTMPNSKLKERLAEVLEREGFIDSHEVKQNPRGAGQILEIRLRYSEDRERTISGIERVSKPGLRVYVGARNLPRVLGGLGVAVLSTSKGLMTDKEARKARVGGEVLCRVW